MPERSKAAADKQASAALAALEDAEAKRLAREARAKRAREAGNRRAEAAQPKPKPKPKLAAVRSPAPEPVREFDLEKAVKSLQPEFIQCRDWGHSWRPFTARWINTMNHYESILRCARCETERVRYIGHMGQILGSKYDYQDGYQMKGSGVLSTSDRDQIRLASIRIIEVKDTVQE